MKRSLPQTLAGMFVAMAAAYGAGFWGMVTFDADSALSRFDALEASRAYGRAAGHGDQVLALRRETGRTAGDFPALQARVARAHDEGGDPYRAIALYRAVLDGPLGQAMTAEQRMGIETRIARLSFRIGDPIAAAVIFGDFVDRAGDEAAKATPEDPDSLEARYLEPVRAAMPDFTDALLPVPNGPVILGDEETRLKAADQLTRLGGYYARLPNGDYAAAGVLAAAYEARRTILDIDHQDTVHTALLLAPVYERIDRVTDAEAIYLDAFHAQERARGSNNPELSLYIRLLADIYRRQGRLTEAEALNTHMRNLFRDAFGARRYAPNQDRDRRADVNRPVSSDFPLPADYTPPDLVAASRYNIALSKPPGVEEMRFRLAELSEDNTLPAQLGALMASCTSPGERLTLRSGYRSHATQVSLYRRSRNGQVTEPGTSEHQTGLAVDIDVNGRFMRSTDRAYQCFEAQAWRYGFILTYPQGNTYLPGEDTFEPWHWRFVGKQTALLYRELGPLNMPMEFLAALPCYEERALSGLFIQAGDDVCLARRTNTANRKGDPGTTDALRDG